MPFLLHLEGVIYSERVMIFHSWVQNTWEKKRSFSLLLNFTKKLTLETSLSLVDGEDNGIDTRRKIELDFLKILPLNLGKNY